jgi:hypothetical protein
MKASQTCFRFPLLGFTPDPGLGEIGYVFPDLESLTVCRAYTLKLGMPEGLELIDAGGARWKVRAVEKVRRHGPLGWWLIGAPLNWQRYRVDYELEPLPAVTLAEVQDRVCAEVQMFGDLDNPSEADQAHTAATVAKIRRAKTIAKVAELSEWKAFRGLFHECRVEHT